MKLIARHWPLVLQILGALAVAVGLALLFGFAVGLIALGVEAVAVGMLAEAEPPEAPVEGAGGAA